MQHCGGLDASALAVAPAVAAAVAADTRDVSVCSPCLAGPGMAVRIRYAGHCHPADGVGVAARGLVARVVGGWSFGVSLDAALRASEEWLDWPQ